MYEIFPSSLSYYVGTWVGAVWSRYLEDWLYLIIIYLLMYSVTKLLFMTIYWVHRDPLFLIYMVTEHVWIL